MCCCLRLRLFVRCCISQCLEFRLFSSTRQARGCAYRRKFSCVCLEVYILWTREPVSRRSRVGAGYLYLYLSIYTFFFSLPCLLFDVLPFCFCFSISKVGVFLCYAVVWRTCNTPVHKKNTPSTGGNSTWRTPSSVLFWFFSRRRFSFAW